MVDVVAILSGSANPANYWRVLKKRLRDEDSQTIAKCNAFKLKAPDGKLGLTDCLDSTGVIALAKIFPGNKAMVFLDWFLYSDNTLDGQSKEKAYFLFENGILKELELGRLRCLQQIHAYLCGGRYDFAGKIRTHKTSAMAALPSPTLFASLRLCKSSKKCQKRHLTKFWTSMSR